ncbi:MAG: CPBP family intramembrane metalloprotease [Oscillospiraceae bacterium]|nr:CPBP family intramembrane metalloprotease [Oscillospiraceae bacterium]
MPDKKLYTDNMTQRERIAAGIYLPAHMFILPALLGTLVQISGREINEIGINVAYYVIGILFVLLLMRKFLRADFDALLDNKSRSFVSLILAFALLYALSAAVAAILIFVTGDEMNPNSEAVSGLIHTGSGPMFHVIVLLAPVIEEVLFRGFLFGSLRRKSRLAAYIISALAFSIYHIWQYLLIYMDFGLMLFGLQYIPHSIALGWSYERSGSIWVPIFMHILINGAAFALSGGFPISGF